MKILAVLPRFPYPLEKGDKLRAYHLLKGLAKDHEIAIFALSDKAVSAEDKAAIETFATEYQVFRQDNIGIATQTVKGWLRGWPLQMGYYYHPLAARQLKAFVKFFKPDRLYFQLLRTAIYAKDFPTYPKTLDYMDAFAAGMQRRAQQSTLPIKWIWQNEYARLKRWEATVYPYFDQHTVITTQDEQLINRPSGKPIKVISNGIDLAYFQPNPAVEKDIDIIFAGNMSYAPNVQAAKFIVQSILPLLLPSHPSISIAFVGTDPHPSVQQLAGPHVQVTGWVDNIAEWYNRSKVMLAPMQIGAGLQNKLLEAMAMGLPTVTTPLAQQAMPKETIDFVSVAQEATEFATTLTTLLASASLRDEYGKAGQAYVRHFHNWKLISADLGKYLSQL